MTLRQVLQGLRNLRQQLDWMIGDAMSKPVDLGVQLRRNRMNAQSFERSDQGVRKAVQAVAMRYDAFALHLVEHLAHLLGREFVVIQKRDEARDGPLEVDVVLPER